jgi:hypothetical protein
MEDLSCHLAHFLDGEPSWMFHPECHVRLSLLTLNYVQLRNIATSICHTQSLPLPERNKQAYVDVIVRDFRSQTRYFSKTDVNLQNIGD